MNYDLMTWIEYFIGSMTCCFGGFFVGKILLNKKLSSIKIYSYLLIILFSLLTIINSLTFNNIAKIFGTLFIQYLIYKLVFREKIINSFLYAVITYILFITSEITISIFIILIEKVFAIDILLDFMRTIFINFVVSILSCVYAYFIKRKVKLIVSVISKNNIFYIFILGVVTIFVLLSSMYKLYINNWVIDYTFLLDMIIIVGCVCLLLVLLKQYLKNKELVDKYNLLEDYMKTSAELIEKYSTTNHKYKNNLIAIKGYIKSDMKEAEKYIDNLLENYNNKKYSWFSRINNIKLDTLRYLVYFKLSKAEAADLKISVDVSSRVKKYTNEYLTLHQNNVVLEIIGEYFDNAIYASRESKEKELSFVLYEEDCKLIFIIANTYRDEVNLSLITKNGYTTKGKDHGLGLYDIDKTIRNLSWIENKYELTDNYFVATLSIFINKKRVVQKLSD